jgi:prepilin-type N-terminal cleavage/methylation domain-containing protein
MCTGFALRELMIVIAIFSTIAIPNLLESPR